MYETLLWLAIWSTMLLGIGMLRGRAHETRAAKILLLPGVLLDSVLRAVSALVTVTPIERFSPLAHRRPGLETGRSKLGAAGVVGDVVLRLVLLVAICYYWAFDLPAFLRSGFSLPFLDPASVREHGIHWPSFARFWQELAQLPALLEVHEIGSMLLCWAIAGALFFGGLEAREWLASQAAIVTCALVGLGFGWLGVKFGFLSRGWYISAFYVPEVWSTLSLVVLFSAAIVLFLGVLRVFFLLMPSSGSEHPHPAASGG